MSTEAKIEGSDWSGHNGYGIKDMEELNCVQLSQVRQKGKNSNFPRHYYSKRRCRLLWSPLHDIA